MNKTTTITIDTKTLGKLKEFKDKTGLTQSELVEIGISILYSKYKRKENDNQRIKTCA